MTLLLVLFVCFGLLFLQCNSSQSMDYKMTKAGINFCIEMRDRLSWESENRRGLSYLPAFGTHHHYSQIKTTASEMTCELNKALWMGASKVLL